MYYNDICMKVINTRVMKGPNYWSITNHKLIVMLLNLQEQENTTTNAIPGFYERLTALIPSLETHLCLDGTKGGFLNRVKSGTTLAHVVEHIALEIQSLAGMKVDFGRAVESDKRGIYHVVFAYEESRAGTFAANEAVAITEALLRGEPYDLNAAVKELQYIAEDDKWGPSTYSVIKEALNRNIPVTRLDDQSLVQLGFGAKQKRVQATIASTTGCIAVEIAGDKEATKRILESAEVPVPKGDVVYDEAELKEAIENIGYPVAIKPVDGNHGKGATIGIRSEEEAIEALKVAKHYSKRVIVESAVEGFDFRALVINYKFVAAALRTPACVTGDGVHNIRELVEMENQNPKRGHGHDKVLTLIKIDDATIHLLEKKGYTLQTVLPAGEEVYA